VLTLGQIRAALLHAAVPHGHAERYAAILAGHGFIVTFRGLIPGALRVTWKSNRTVLGSGTLDFTGAGPHKLHLKLTGAGTRLLRAHAGVLSATIAFRPAGGRTLTFSERFSLG
jgi:hypothetical protein